MSNGDDVLDNWEEIDEVGLDSKLNKLKEERKTQQKEQDFISTADKFFDSQEEDDKLPTFTRSSLQRQVQIQQQQISPLDDMSSFQNTVPLMMVLHKPDDEYQSANYMQPTKSQTVKILRRPTQSNEIRGNGMRPKQPIKSLQQREQEYAEARLRILGSAKNPEDDAETSSTAPASATPKVHSNNIYHNANSSTASVNASTGGGIVYSKIPESQMACGGGGNGVSPVPASIWPSATRSIDVETTGFGGAIIVSQSSQNVKQQENVLRMPKGPDGSLGFQMRR